MVTDRAIATTTQIFHLKIDDGHAIVLPPELRERLEVDPEDIVAISVVGNQTRIPKVSEVDAARPVVKRPMPEAKGLLRDSFTDWEDVKRFVEEERRGEDEPEDPES